jgi:hypothetical protein
MSATYEFITKQTLGAEAATVTFSNIPQTFTDLLIVSSARSARTVNLADNLNLRFNGDAGGNYSFRYLEGNGSGASSVAGSSAAQMLACYTPTAAATASTFGVASIYVANYAGSTAKAVSCESVTENNGTTAFIVATAGLWSGTVPVTSVTLLSQVANFVAGSSFFVYGIRRASGDPGVFMDASGGDVTISGGYKVHTFRSSGVLQVNTPGWAEALVVGGGGGGQTGGGGAGGYVSRNLLLPGGPITVAVGAGGAGNFGVNVAASNGGDSSIGGLAVAFGGGGAAGFSNSGLNSGRSGGSGGGAGGSDSGGNPGTPGAGTSGQGNAGGNAVALNTNQGRGGGGGAGAVGGNGSGTVSGAGGAGLTWVDGVTRAGGGGGGANGGTAGAGGSGGGGAGANQATGTAGTVNTGGGGGGGLSDSTRPGAAGGSGIVIVRYPYR